MKKSMIGKRHALLAHRQASVKTAAATFERNKELPVYFGPKRKRLLVPVRSVYQVVPDTSFGPLADEFQR